MEKHTKGYKLRMKASMPHDEKFTKKPRSGSAIDARACKKVNLMSDLST